MIDFSNFIDLPLVWGVLIATAVFLYALLDGFDLGFPFLYRPLFFREVRLLGGLLTIALPFVLGLVDRVGVVLILAGAPDFFVSVFLGY